MTTIALLTLGGTISSEAASADAGSGVIPLHGAARFAEEIAHWLTGVELRPETVHTVPSPSLGFADVLALAQRIRSLASTAGVPGSDSDADGEPLAPVDGVVVSQGTDTIEETAFVLDLLLADLDLPVAVTGAMRSRDDPSPDGAANLVAAIDVVSQPASRGLGVLVVLADQVHAARWVSKRSTFRVDAFDSSPLGPIGRVVERRFRLESAPVRPRAVELAALVGGVVEPARIALAGTGLGDDLALLPGLPALGYRGVVVDGMGGGHVASEALANVDLALERMPVVIASRTGAGPVLSTTYGYPGGEIDLVRRGAIPAGTLTAVKARLLLALLVAAGAAPRDIRDAFAALA